MQVSKIQPVLDIESSLCLAYSIQAYSIIYKCSNFFLHFEKKKLSSEQVEWLYVRFLNTGIPRAASG